MALSALEITGLTVAGIVTAGAGYTVVQQARTRAKSREQRGLSPPRCQRGMSPKSVDGSWQCLPVTAFEDCLVGVFVSDRVPLPESVEGLLSENARKTAEQFFGFHLSPEALEEAYTALAAQIPALAQEGDAAVVYYSVRGDLMPCVDPTAKLHWPDIGAPMGSAEASWPVKRPEGPNLWYVDGPPTVSDRMDKAARSLADLYLVALSQHKDQFIAMDQDPVMVVSDPQLDACTADIVIDPRKAGVPTSEGVILGALALAGYDPQTQTVEQIMTAIETENPSLVQHLEADWRISAPMQDDMWRILLEVAAFPRPITNVVFNLGVEGCPWDQKDAYSLSMATLWYSAKRIAAIAELSGLNLPIGVAA